MKANSHPSFEEVVKDRDQTFIEFVRSGDLNPVREYCQKWGVPIPDNEQVLMAGVYKAVQEIVGIPDDIKQMAAEKCIALGFKPYAF